MRIALRRLSLPWLIILYSIGSIVVLLVGWNVVLPYVISISPFGMQDEFQQKATSSDSRYIAKLFYRDGLTFGYQHITLETSSWHPFGYGYTDLVEVASEGLMSVSWKNTRTLVIVYDGTKNKNSDCDTYFVTQPKAWGDVKIIYRPN